MPKNSSFHLPKRSYASSRAHDQKRCSINRNRLTVGTRTVSSTTTQINYGLDAAGNLTSDGLRLFEYDASNRLAKVLVSQNAEASKITYLHNALGQRVFKSEPTVAYTAPDEAVLGTDFITWLKKNFGWLFAQAQVNATLGQGYVYDEANLGATPNLLGEYGNGGTKSAGRIEYIWLPTEDGQSIPIGIYKGGRFYAVHADHINTPRLITDDTNKPVWQWPYSAFGENKPSGILKATPNPRAAITNQPQLLKATAAALEVNLRYPGQYFDEESNLSYNLHRSYQFGQGRYTQPDPVGLNGGWSRFAYVENNPLGATDPLGLQRGPPARGAYYPRGQMPRPPTMSTRETQKQLLNDISDFLDPNNPNFGKPIPGWPSDSKPYCRLVCPSSTPNSCPANSPAGLPERSLSGEMCTRVCDSHPRLSSVPQ